MKSFVNIEGDSNFRPYSAGMSNREVSMASLVLFQNKDVAKESDKANTWGYQNFKTTVGVSLSNSLSNTLDSNIVWLDENAVIPTLDFSKYMSQQGTNTYYGVFNNFAVTSVSEAREELVRINMNFGGNWNAFFFGENPRVFTVQGLLLDSPEYPYYQEFLSAYDMYLSGRKAIANQMEIALTYDGRIVSGYILKLMNENTAEQYNLKSFAFTILVKHDSWFRYNADAAGAMSLNSLDNTNRYEAYRNERVAETQAAINNPFRSPDPSTAPSPVDTKINWPPQIAPKNLTTPEYRSTDLNFVNRSSL